MVSPAGSKIPETVVGEFHCNTKAAGWLNGAHPTGKFFTMSVEFEKVSSSSDCNDHKNGIDFYMRLVKWQK